METTIIRLKKSRTVIYLICFLGILAASIYFTVQDMENPNSWLLIYFFSIVISVYHIALYTADIFSRNAGLRIDNEGITLDYEHFRNLTILWNDISDYRLDKSLLSVFLHNPDKYLARIFKISELIIRGNVKRLGTFVLIRTNQFHIDRTELEKVMHNTFNEYKKQDRKENTEKG